MLYLDNSATTKVLPEVLDEMVPYISNYYGNPNSLYYEQANKAKDAVGVARNRVAEFLNCREDEVIFTSGATESNNFIMKGYTHANKKKGKHIVVSSVEHSCILNTAKFLEGEGFEVTYLPVDRRGFVELSVLEKEIRKDTVLVSIMWANNELGSINDVRGLSNLCHSKGVLFHTDATQYAGKGKIDLVEYGDVDFLSFSAHKLYGPKGAGVAFVRKDSNGLYPDITPLIHGGGQEFGLRSGTLAVHQIVGVGKAARIANERMDDNIKKLKQNELKFIKRMKDVFGDNIIINNNFENRVPGLISIRVKGFNNQLFLKKAAGVISASTGSACSNAEPSYVLKACGFTDEEISETIRFSLSAYGDYRNFREIE